MAPNKKKKKAATNPARGFATTSVASKQQTIESQDGLRDELSPAERSGVESNEPRVDGEVPKSSAEKPLHELSPEELEVHLEDADLQAFLEKHGDKVKRDVSRQITRLITEKRLLRMQAERLNNRPWLPAELMERVVAYIDADSNYAERSSLLTAFSNEPFPNDHLILCLWRLCLILPKLGFSNENTDEALRLLSSKCSQEVSILSNAGKDRIWGLDLCLDWLACRDPGDGKSDYDAQHRNQAADRLEPSDSEDLGVCLLLMILHYSRNNHVFDRAYGIGHLE